MELHTLCISKLSRSRASGPIGTGTFKKIIHTYIHICVYVCVHAHIHTYIYILKYACPFEIHKKLSRISSHISGVSYVPFSQEFQVRGAFIFLELPLALKFFSGINLIYGSYHPACASVFQQCPSTPGIASLPQHLC